MINPTFFSSNCVIARGRCYGDRLFAQIGKKLAYPSLFCAMAFHNGWEDRNRDARVNTADDPFDPLVHLFLSFVSCSRRTGDTLSFATHF